MGDIKLHLGCGKNYLEGYVNIDKYDTSRADEICDVLCLPFKDDSVQEICAFHLIEHLSYEEFDIAILEWHRVLKKDGILVLEFPDFVKCMLLYIFDIGGKRSYWKKTIYGEQTQIGRFHKNGFTFKEVKKKLLDIGFSRVTRIKPSKRPTPSIRVMAAK